jgi:nucleotide-binding universal stress UspA family protein
MKPILFPTDFSKAADNALDFAALLARVYRTRLVLFHTYYLVMPTDTYGTFVSESLINQTEKQAKEQIGALRDKLISQYEYFKEDSSRLQVRISYGNPTDAIEEEAEVLDPLFIVMGSKGVSNRVGEFFGSVTSTLAGQLECPLFVIPAEAKANTLQNLCYATDFEGNEDPVINTVKELAISLNARLHVLHITRNNEIITAQKMEKLESLYADESIYFSHQYRDSVIEGLEKYVETRKPDALILATLDRDFFQGIFHKSVTRHMALTAKVPLVVLHKKALQKGEDKSAEFASVIF